MREGRRTGSTAAWCPSPMLPDLSASARLAWRLPGASGQRRHRLRGQGSARHPAGALKRHVAQEKDARCTTPPPPAGLPPAGAVDGVAWAAPGWPPFGAAALPSGRGAFPGSPGRALRAECALSDLERGVATQPRLETVHLLAGALD